jgi:hypothetical protein
MGDAYDLHLAVERAYEALQRRRYGGLRVDVDPPPPVEDVVGAARLNLRPALRDRFTDEQMAERARRYAGLPAWPFSVLLP